MADPRAAPPRRAGGDDPRGDRDRPVVPGRDGPQRPHRRRGTPRGLESRGRHFLRGSVARHRQASRLWRPGAGWARERGGERRPRRPTGRRSAAWLRDGGYVRGRVRRRDPVFLCNVCGGRLAARGHAGFAARSAGDRFGAGPDRAGDRIRLLRRAGRRSAPCPGLAGGHDQLEPGDGIDGLRCLVPPLLRAPRSGVGPERGRRRDAGRGGATPGVRAIRRPDTAQSRRATRGLGRAAPGHRPGRHRPGGGAHPVRGAAGPPRHPATGRWYGAQRRGGADPGRADRLSGHRPALIRDRRAGNRLLLLA